jgi:hypothetical protein
LQNQGSHCCPEDLQRMETEKHQQAELTGKGCFCDVMACALRA